MHFMSHVMEVDAARMVVMSQHVAVMLKPGVVAWIAIMVLDQGDGDNLFAKNVLLLTAYLTIMK